MTSFSLSSHRRDRPVTLAVSATVALYAIFAVVAEPARTLAATDTETVVVSLTVATGIGLSCDANDDGSHGSGETLSLGSITFTGDTSSGSSLNIRRAKCRILTSNSAGYTLGWHVATGNTGRSTGHLATSNGLSTIAAFSTGANHTKRFDTNVATTDSRWAGRVVVSRSSGSQVGALDFGTDGADTTEKWARIATGSTVPIRTTAALSQSGSGDKIEVAFRARIGVSKIQPTGTYTSTVTFTATTL